MSCDTGFPDDERVRARDAKRRKESPGGAGLMQIDDETKSAGNNGCSETSFSVSMKKPSGEEEVRARRPRPLVTAFASEELK